MMVIAAVIILQVKSVDYRGGSRYVRSARSLGSKSLASLLAAPTLDYNALQNCTRIVRHVGGGQEVANTEIPSCSKVAGGELRSS